MADADLTAPKYLPKTPDVILLVDNRNEKLISSQLYNSDFRSSTFKQTQIDPLESKPDINIIYEDNQVFLNLKKRVQELEKRIKILEVRSTKSSAAQDESQDRLKKKRRKFAELIRNHQCPYRQCQKIYGSDTSLKNHLKLKHRKAQ